MAVVEWHGPALQARLNRAVQAYGQILDEQMKLEITAKKWYWDEPTLRFESRFIPGKFSPPRGYVIPGGLRDIVDTGRLLDSQQLQYGENGGFTLSWVGYAWNVIHGVYPSYINPHQERALPLQIKRNFVRAGLDAIPAGPFIAEAWRSNVSL